MAVRETGLFNHLSGTIVIDNDGMEGGGEAVFFTDPAPATEFGDHHRAIDTVLVLFRSDSLVSTVFLADQTVLIQAPGNAALPVDPGGTHLEVAFFTQGQIPDGLSRAGLTTFIAELITLPGGGNQTGGKDPLQSPFQERRLETTGQADPDTTSTADTAVGEFIFRERARRTDQPRVKTGPPAVEEMPDKSRRQSSPQGQQGSPPAWISRALLIGGTKTCLQLCYPVE